MIQRSTPYWGAPGRLSSTYQGLWYSYHYYIFLFFLDTVLSMFIIFFLCVWLFSTWFFYLRFLSYLSFYLSFICLYTDIYSNFHYSFQSILLQFKMNHRLFCTFARCYFDIVRFNEHSNCFVLKRFISSLYYQITKP